MIEITDALLIGVIIGIVELLKIQGVPKKALPIVALFLGVAGGIVYIAPNDWKEGVLMGVIMGLSASGLYSGGKALVEREEVSKGER